MRTLTPCFRFHSPLQPKNTGAPLIAYRDELEMTRQAMQEVRV